MLIPSDRITKADAEHWLMLERADEVRAQLKSLTRKAERSMGYVRDFASRGRCYVSVSWGKDSVVLAHLAATSGIDLPFVWVNVQPMANPDCIAVRDAFLARFPVRYDEIVVECKRGADGEWIGTGRLESGFAVAAKRYGANYLSGVRAEESGIRKRRMQACGPHTKHTSAPIGWWSTDDVFAYLHKHDLPIHPAYAMTRGGTLDRNRLRVATIGGSRGVGFGRTEWELTYYPDVMRIAISDAYVESTVGAPPRNGTER